MPHTKCPEVSSAMNRRQCLARTTTTAASLVATASAISKSAYASESDVIKVGIVGCGGRGAGAVGHALSTGPNVKLVAMADAYQDRLDITHSSLMRSKAGRSKLAVGDGPSRISARSLSVCCRSGQACLHGKTGRNRPERCSPNHQGS